MHDLNVIEIILSEHDDKWGPLKTSVCVIYELLPTCCFLSTHQYKNKGCEDFLYPLCKKDYSEEFYRILDKRKMTIINACALKGNQTCYGPT